jgi:hypothetical protein
MKVGSHMRWLLDLRRTHEKRVSRRLGDLTMIHPWWMEFTLIQCSQDGRLLELMQIRISPQSYKPVNALYCDKMT